MSSQSFPITPMIPNPELTCSVCNQRMSTKDSLRRHMMRHTGEKPYACHVCDYRSIQKTHLKAHIFYNHGEQELKTVSLTPQLVPSVRKKLKKKEIERMEDQRFPYGPYRCEQCNVGFRKNDNLQRHNLKRHKNEPDTSKNKANPVTSSSSIVIPSISKISQKLKLKKPNLPSLPIPTSFYQQSVPHITPFSFNSDPVSLLAYVRCPVCAKLVSSDNRLRKHLLTHVGIRPYPCPTCGKVFKQKYHLKRHLIRVHKPAGMTEITLKPGYDTCFGTEKSLRGTAALCPVCSRVLSNGDTLRRHMLIHQGIKPFSCEYCGETFRQKHHVQVHVKRHHRNDPSTASCSSSKTGPLILGL